MPRPRIQNILMSLSFAQKLLLAGSLLMAISLFLPWYQDIDQFKTGDMFLGISGPMYLAGLTLLLLVVINSSLLFMEVTGKTLPFSLKPSQIYLASGLAAFYFLILVNSVYFHQKFGVNISVKQSDFGMFFAFIAASLMTIGGYLATRDKAQLLKEFQKEAQSPFVMPQSDVRKPKENLRSVPQPKAVYQKTSHIPIKAVEPKMTVHMESNDLNQEMVLPTSKKAPQPFRTDL